MTYIKDDGNSIPKPPSFLTVNEIRSRGQKAREEKEQKDLETEYNNGKERSRESAEKRTQAAAPLLKTLPKAVTVIGFVKDFRVPMATRNGKTRSRDLVENIPLLNWC